MAATVITTPNGPSVLPTHILPTPFQTPQSPASATNAASSSLSYPTLLTQGAEALVYQTKFLSPSIDCALKYRPPKPYRHATLDKRLTRARILAEARVLVRCRKEGVCVPGVLGLDWDAGWLALEWIPGYTIRACLDRYLHSFALGDEVSATTAPELFGLMVRVGKAVGRLHEIGVVHGDLTTSNLMLRPPHSSTPPSVEGQLPSNGATVTPFAPQEHPQSLAGQIVLIDFGLAAQTVQDEERAVDLYVLERAFASTHPQAEPLFREVLRVYGDSFRGAKVVLRRLEDVRRRGRKKSMVG